MLSVDKLCKSYGPFPVLDNVSFNLNRDMRVGLVGANGVGKSTLLKIIAGQEAADGGKISVDSQKTIGYLPQTLPLLPGNTVDELIYESTSELRQLETRMRDMEKTMSTSGGVLPSSLMDEYSEVSVRFEELGGYDLDYRADAVMAGLGLGSIEKTRLVETLSGGEKTRLGLVILLLRSPDVLLLDEPTNNLDNKCLEWLEGYLNGYRGGIIMVSHDRQFLNAAANWIYEIDEHAHSLARYHGNYDDFKSVKSREKIKWEEDYRRQQEEIKELRRVMRTTASGTKRRQKPQDGDKLVFNFKGERLQSTVSRTIRSAQERLARITEDPIPKPPKPLRFKARLASDEIKSAEVIRAERLSKSYDGKAILQDISFTLGADSRVVITGPNGSGKTTLLRLLSGKEKPDSGVVTCSPSIRLGYLPQAPDNIQPSLTVLEYYRSGLTGYEEDFIFSLVTCGLFNYDEINKTLAQLSFGQIRKLEIARLIASEPNVLVLDEPTNHISLDVLESLEAAITRFKGPVLAVSHDRRFIRKFGREIWELADGKVFLGGLR